MSTDKKPESQVTEAGAVELDETQLDDAAGGFSLNYSKIVVEHKATTSTTEVVGDGSVRPPSVST